jgi:3-hydroxybutyryl-CoA dehydrogenase
VEQRRIAVVGAGMMGQGCAHAFAAAGHQVMLQSLDDELFRGVLERIRVDLVFLAERGVGSMDGVEATVSRITTTPRLDEALDGADFVLECIYEDLEAKRGLFHEMERLAGPRVILATNTSVIRITEIAQACEHRDRVVGVHWWNPAYLVPLVEVVPGEETSEETVQAALAILRESGKYPLRINKDVPGFVGNRLLHALYREAFSIVEEGIADAATVDRVFKFGPGMRFPVLAPFEHADMVGLDLTLAVESYLLKFLEDSHEPAAMLKNKVAKGELGFKAGGNGFESRSPEEQRAIRLGLLDHLARWTARADREASKLGP